MGVKLLHLLRNLGIPQWLPLPIVGLIPTHGSRHKPVGQVHQALPSLSKGPSDPPGQSSRASSQSFPGGLFADINGTDSKKQNYFILELEAAAVLCYTPLNICDQYRTSPAETSAFQIGLDLAAKHGATQHDQGHKEGH